MNFLKDAVIRTLLSCLLGCSLCEGVTPEEMRALSLLFDQFDTVSYTNTALLSGFEARDAKKRKELAAAEPPFALRVPFLTLAAALHPLGADAVRSLGQDYSAFAAGARDFTPPQGGLGVWNARACFIGISHKKTHDGISRVFGPAKVQLMDGLPAWTWSIPPYEGNPKTTVFYAAQVGDSYFVLANDEQVFRDIRDRLSTWKKPLERITGLEKFSESSYWSYRRGPGTIQGAKVLVFLADAERMKASVLVYAGSSTPERTKESLPSSRHVRYEHIEPDLWRGTFGLSQDEPNLSSILFGVLYHLGFAINL